MRSYFSLKSYNKNILTSEVELYFFNSYTVYNCTVTLFNVSIWSGVFVQNFGCYLTLLNPKTYGSRH